MKDSERKNGQHGKVKRPFAWFVPLLLLVLFAFNGCLPFPIARHKRYEENAQAKFEEAVLKIYPESGSIPVDLVVPPEIGSPAATEFHSYWTYMAIYESNAYTLLCSYGEEEYAAAKAAIEARYSFRTEPLDAGYVPRGQKAVQIEPYARIGDDCFRFLLPADEDDQDGWDAFYKRCLMVMTNDAEHEIGFIVFQDLDLDEAEDLAEFLNLWCGWKYIR